MDKNFDDWNIIKKTINSKDIAVFIHPKEVWWCSFGVNIGAEVNGKHGYFERPCIIMKVYNKETVVV